MKCLFCSFSLDLDYVLERALNSGVEKMILTANTLQMSDKSVMLANQHPGVLFAGVGIHPHFVEKQWNAKNIEIIKRLVALPEVIAIGEVGLDFHRNYSKEAIQIEAFEKQVSGNLRDLLVYISVLVYSVVAALLFFCNTYALDCRNVYDYTNI